METLSWARAHGSKITMVHSVFFDSEEFSISPGQLEKRIKEGKAACEQAMETYPSEFGIEMDYLVREGEPHEVVPAVAAEIGADLIALGTYGRKGLKRMVMGSVTAGVIINSHCDVMVVRKQCEDCTGEYHRILVPFDDSRLSHLAVERVAEVADPQDASLTILYVIPRYEEMIEFFNTSSIRGRVNEEAHKIVLEGERIADERGMKAHTMVEEGRVADKVVETAKGLGSDLIILGSHGRRGIDKSILGSTTERVIAHSPIPVLVVK